MGLEIVQRSGFADLVAADQLEPLASEHILKHDWESVLFGQFVS